jgi:CheY-like chemotaxis protein
MPSILIVDDETAIADTLVLIFNRSGYVANAVYSALDALDFIASNRPALVISDVVMPGMDGVALAKRICTQYSDCKVLLFSGNASTSDLLEQARKEGHTFEVLSKPVPPPQMLAKVACLLGVSQSANLK